MKNSTPTDDKEKKVKAPKGDVKEEVKAGKSGLRKFTFPAQDGNPTIAVEAANIREAEEKYFNNLKNNG